MMKKNADFLSSLYIGIHIDGLTTVVDTMANFGWLATRGQKEVEQPAIFFLHWKSDSHEVDKLRNESNSVYKCAATAAKLKIKSSSIPKTFNAIGAILRKASNAWRDFSET